MPFHICLDNACGKRESKGEREGEIERYGDRGRERKRKRERIMMIQRMLSTIVKISTRNKQHIYTCIFLIIWHSGIQCNIDLSYIYHTKRLSFSNIKKIHTIFQ